ncbi:MAG: hypothetical protein KAW13_02920 [Dehalococcoidia bacterium]|nr:hypothetical protein [Dehalococcoidia bacterium]
MIIILLLAAVLMAPFIAFFSLSLAALAIFVWRKLFPLGWGIAEWVTNRRNLIPFVLFMLLTITATVIMLIVAFLFAVKVHWVGYLVIVVLILILGIASIIFYGGMGLAMILWIIRLSHGGYARFRTGFWRTFRPGGPPALHPVSPLPANPASVLAPPAKPLQRRRRTLPARQPVKRQPPLSTPSDARARSKAKARAKAKEKEKAIAKAKAEAKEKEKAIAKAKAEEKAKAKAKEEDRKAKAREKAQAKAQAKEKAKAKPKLRLRRRRRR